MTGATVDSRTSPRDRQLSFDELGRPLHEVTFCVVDLETTGASVRAGAAITEIGAVKVRGGEVLGEFQTLVDPGHAVPPFISALTGITDGLLRGAPGLDQVLPQFLEFAHGCVLVAHNAPFDVGFLKQACADRHHAWPRFDVVDTAVLARRVVHRDETPNCKLASLAALFHSPTTPTHRALDDARATVDVLHGLLGRLGNLGVTTLEELQTYTSRVTSAQRRKRHLAEHLPDVPGVYLFRDEADRVLYVGTSRHLRTRVRGYFTASETRSRMGRMVSLAARVEGIPCATVLEAQVREIRLIAAHKPSFNRRSRHPERVVWVKLTNEHWPRLSLVRRVLDDGADYLGPFSSKRHAEHALDALHEAFPLRQCSTRMSRRPRLSTCALADLGRCLAPCVQRVSSEDYATTVQAVRASLRQSPTDVLTLLDGRMARLAEAERFEDASRFRDRLSAFVRGAARSQRLRALTGCAEVVAARREAGQWSVHVIRHGRLAGSGVIPPHADAALWVADLSASSETVVPQPGPLPAASAEEAELLLRWLESDGVRLVHVDGDWTCPVGGAERHVARFLRPRTAFGSPD